MSRYQQCFQKLAEKKQGAFVPFVTLGDPNPTCSLNIINTLVEAGADALELGFPFSDPLADGPTIQGANLRALAAQTTPAICFDLIKQVRERYPDLPIGLLMYANLVYARGLDHFYQQCQIAGVDSVLVADVPIHESDDFVQTAEKYGIAPIFIAPPTATADTLRDVSARGKGYTYLSSRAGVTGTETKANMPIDSMLQALKQHNAPPALLGFGISDPEQVKQALAAGAAGAISGSAVVKMIETHQDDETTLLSELSHFIRQMKAATQL